MTNFSFAREGDAGQPGEFLRYGVGSRALGMGRAFVSVADDASAIYWNPAGLMNVQRKEFTSMYSNLYYDSHYSYMAVAIPRTFLGSKSAFGFGWVNLSSVNFDQRDSKNNSFGDFDFHEQAFMFSYAREIVNSYGICNYGGNLKFIDQDFPGLDQSQSSGITGDNYRSGYGLDAGFTFQPINAPLFKIIPLKYLLPLKIGISVQNLFQQKVGHKDVYPRIYRYGLQYKLNVKDWKILMVYDQERFAKRRTGHFGGVEITKPIRNLLPCVRFGANNRTEKFTFGAGLKLSFTEKTMLRLDYAYGSHEFLKSDSRVFLTMEFGQRYNEDYFYEKSNRATARESEKKAGHFQVIARYPNERIAESAIALAKTYDTPNKKRYYKLIGSGLGWATVLFEEAKELLKLEKREAAKTKADKAIVEYERALNKPENEFNENHWLNLGEALMIAEKWSLAADSVIAKVESTSLRYFYQLGICYKNLKRWDSAIKKFRGAIKYENDEKSMQRLSLLGLGISLMEKGYYNAAIDTFTTITKNFKTDLDPDYPRYPIVKDNNIADDAQYLIGKCYLFSGDKEKALQAFAKAKRFYPALENIPNAEKFSEELIIEILK